MPRSTIHIRNASCRAVAARCGRRPWLALVFLLVTSPLVAQESDAQARLLRSVRPSADEDWDPIRPADLVSRTPQVQRDADAEVLFWRVQIKDKLAAFGLQTESWNYLRVKVFTERGCRSQRTVSLVSAPNATIDDVAARTIHPDGSIARLRAEDIHVRTLVQVRKRRERVTTFVFPAVTPGSIIEYHWHATKKRTLASYQRLEFQRDIPVRQVSYYIEPLMVEGQRLPVKTRVFNAANIPIDKDSEGNLSVSMSNLPAALEEPWMPPTGEIRPWLLFFYAEQERGALPVWAKQLFEDQREGLSPSRVAKEVAARILTGAQSGEDSLARLYAYCQRSLRNASEAGSGLGRSEVESLEDEAAAERTLRIGMGTSVAINRAFSNLARAARFEARLALAGDASDVLPASQSSSRSFLTGSVVAIPRGTGWRFFDPGSRYVPFGMLPWTKERAMVLVPDPVAPAILEPNHASAEASSVKRRGRFRLGEDGTLEGDIRIERRGHLAVHERDEHADLSASGWRQAVETEIRSQVPSAILSDMRIDCPNESEKPCTYELRLRVPGFAMTSGKRLALTPAVFHGGHPPRLPARERRSSVVLPFSWSEVDTLTISFPPGFAIEAVDPPVAFHVGAGGRYASSIVADPGGTSLTLIRSHKLLGASIPQQQYQDLWKAFRQLHEVDNRMVSVVRRSSH